ncbi:OBSCN protein, partial [Crypturellus soui]|nr:OBSCN protein [Crypturellus soui]NWI99463.1 OBSCN protein [Crypturellus undulatus]NWI13893.1 OBSCN protein [Crypturellus soui]NWI13910.1 OBSCN protein [Crypturellus soui]NWI99470.1 OBSCN protein [Crypturellus undulatus]
KEPEVTIVEKMKDLTAQEGEDAVFECKLSRETTEESQWFLGDLRLQSNELTEIRAQGNVHSLVLRKVTPEDSGAVSFQVGQQKASA